MKKAQKALYPSSSTKNSLVSSSFFASAQALPEKCGGSGKLMKMWDLRGLFNDDLRSF